MNAQTAIAADAPADAPAKRRIALPKKAWKIGLIALVVAALGIWWLTAPCVTFNSRAAAETVPRRAVASKARSGLSGGRRETMKGKPEV